MPREVYQGVQRRQGDDEGRQQEGDRAGGQGGAGEGGRRSSMMATLCVHACVLLCF